MEYVNLSSVNSEDLLRSVKEFAKKNPSFHTSFIRSVESQFEKKNFLTTEQRKAVEDMIINFEIPII